MNTCTIPELKSQIAQIESEKQTVVDLVRNTRFMDQSIKHFICTETSEEYNKRIKTVTALIHELEGKNEHH